LILDGRLVCFAAAADFLVEIYAGTAVQRWRAGHTARARDDTCMTTKRTVEAEEPFQRVVVPEHAYAAGCRKVRQDVEANFAKQCIVPIDAILVRQPDRIGPPRDPE